MLKMVQLGYIYPRILVTECKVFILIDLNLYLFFFYLEIGI